MRFPWRQVIVAFFGLAALVIILERAGGLSLIVERTTGGLGGLFTSLTPAPRGPAFTTALRNR